MTVNFDQAYARILEVTNCRTQVELAEILGMRQVTLLERFGVSPTWIVTGQGAQYLMPSEQTPNGDTPPSPVLALNCVSPEEASQKKCPFMIDTVTEDHEGKRVFLNTPCSGPECMAWRYVYAGKGRCGRC